LLYSKEKSTFVLLRKDSEYLVDVLNPQASYICKSALILSPSPLEIKYFGGSRIVEIGSLSGRVSFQPLSAYPIP
jgi:hypothetical protein